jgi:hypothetical protein
MDGIFRRGLVSASMARKDKNWDAKEVWDAMVKVRKLDRKRRHRHGLYDSCGRVRLPGFWGSTAW